jgi:hypothetical protein
MTPNSYFGDEELVMQLPQRHCKAVVKRFDTQIFALSSEVRNNYIIFCMVSRLQ